MAQFKILPKTYLLSPLTCFSKKRLFEEICTLVSSITDIKERILLQALNERESFGSTVCAKGIGIPHALIDSLDESLAVLTIIQKEVPYNTVDTDYMGVDVALAFFISPKDDYDKIEQMLRIVSRELDNTEMANSLRRSWQDNNKLVLILQKLDALLNQEFKNAPAKAPANSATNSIMQFINDAIGQ